METSHRIRRGYTEVAGSLGALRREVDVQRGGGGQWRAGHDVRAKLISVQGKAKVQHCDHLDIISESHVQVLNIISILSFSDF